MEMLSWEAEKNGNKNENKNHHNRYNINTVYHIHEWWSGRLLLLFGGYFVAIDRTKDEWKSTKANWKENHNIDHLQKPKFISDCSLSSASTTLCCCCCDILSSSYIQLECPRQAYDVATICQTMDTEKNTHTSKHWLWYFICGNISS